MNILQSISDPDLFAPFFRDRESWSSWRTFLAALFGLPVEDEQLFSECTGGRPLPTQQSREAYVIVGRRGGKSYVAALVVVYLAAFRTYRLSPGERGICMVLATDKKQAEGIFRYCRAFIQGVPMLAGSIVRETADTLELSNGVAIEVHVSSFRSVRGRTLVAAVCDEVAFWRSDESANPDTEVLNALRPSMATIPNSLLLCLSTPYSRSGILWSAYRKHFGKGTDVLVWQAPTLTMNPLVSQSFIDSAYEDDPTAASAEFGATFRSDLESYVNPEVVDAAIIPGRFELPPVAGTRYRSFCDPAGGSGTDSMTLAIGHTQRDIAVLDLVRERKPPFSPEAVVQEFVADLKRYGLYEVHGDKYAGDWPAERFQTHEIRYRPSEKTKSDIYQAALPKLNSKRVELLDDKVLRTQLLGLERHTSRGGRDSIDHRPGAHDDIANAAAGVLALCTPTVELTADMFAQGVINFGSDRRDNYNIERMPWDQKSQSDYDRMKR